MTAIINGAKLALLHEDRVLTYRRDDFATIPFPDHWDLPGGGREGDETARDCALRELAEEFGIHLPPERLLWERAYPSVHVPGRIGVFFAGQINASEIAAIRFGSEGQHWQMMPVVEFLTHTRAVPYLQARLREYLAETD
ncbi:MAG: NUDIX hydrolase [Paracoccaceae bacterium]